MALDAGDLARRSRLDGPFTAEHLLRVLGANAVAVVLMVAAWYEAAGTGSLRTGLAWLNISLLALIVSGAANGIWLLRQRQLVTLARVAVLPSALASRSEASVEPLAARTGAADSLVWAPGMTRYHLAGCPLVIGKPTDALDSAGALAALRPCETCEP